MPVQHCARLCLEHRIAQDRFSVAVKRVFAPLQNMEVGCSSFSPTHGHHGSPSSPCSGVLGEPGESSAVLSSRCLAQSREMVGKAQLHKQPRNGSWPLFVSSFSVIENSGNLRIALPFALPCPTSGLSVFLIASVIQMLRLDGWMYLYSLKVYEVPKTQLYLEGLNIMLIVITYVIKNVIKAIKG